MEVPGYALEIYNVLNGTHYDNPAQLRIMKLEKGVQKVPKREITCRIIIQDKEFVGLIRHNI